MNDMSVENPLTVVAGYFLEAAHLPVRPADFTLLHFSRMLSIKYLIVFRIFTTIGEDNGCSLLLYRWNSGLLHCSKSFGRGHEEFSKRVMV